jgi:hypothetical protein
MAKSVLLVVLALVCASCTAPTREAGAGASFAGPLDAGLMAEPRSREASGLAASRRTPEIVWTHDDSDGSPILHALDTRDGSLRGQVRVAGVQNIDWEDIASFELRGEAWLCAGDTGDNRGGRPEILLHFLREPDPALLIAGTEIVLHPDYTLRVIFEDGPRDCEALAVDASERMVYLLSKREAVPRLYRVPLDPAEHPVVARLVGTLPHLPQPNPAQRALRIPTGLYRASPCAMDFAPDRSGAVVLTYGDLLYFPRTAQQTWGEALAQQPFVLPPHRLPQAEAACFSADGRVIFVSSELTARFLRYVRR